MELRRYLRILAARWLLLAVCAVVGIAAAYATLPDRARYEATSTIYVGNRHFGQQGSLSNDQTAGVERVARTFAVMLASEPIAREAVQRSGLPLSPRQIVSRTQTIVIPGTSLIRVSYRDADPTVAQSLANALSDALVDKVQDFEPGVGGEGEVPALPAYVFARAELPFTPEETGAVGRLLTGALFGLVLAATVALLLDYLDITPRSVDDLERRLGLPVLGVIPLLPDAVAHQVVSGARVHVDDQDRTPGDAPTEVEVRRA